ncbi:hypothetical protein, partial [Acetobacter cerevisiae]|uniref:hypothetical protein n=1 Tax=Acetobacter cerevisiae TaxID=178900 RepID=UPI00209F68FF
KRRAKATPGAINQHAKTLKSGARRINQRFFDLSTSSRAPRSAKTLATPEPEVDAPLHERLSFSPPYCRPSSGGRYRLPHGRV